MRDEDVEGGLWEKLRDKRWRWGLWWEKGWGIRDEDGRGVVLGDKDWKTWAIKVKSEDGGEGWVER